MRRILSGLILSLGLALPASAQSSVNVIDKLPDCNFYLNTTTAGASSSAVFDNRQKGCKFWTVTYNVNGFGPVSVEFDSAPDAAGVPGAFAAFCGTVVNGVNPLVAVTSASSQFSGYYPWVKIAYTLTGAGSLTGRVYGWREPPPAGSTTATISGNVPVVTICNKSAVFNLSGLGSTQIVALSGTTSTYICHISLATVAGEDIKLVYGTGANCAAGPADLTGLYKGVNSMALDLFGALVAPAGQAVCLNQSVAQATGGVVVFAQF